MPVVRTRVPKDVLAEIEREAKTQDGNVSAVVRDRISNPSFRQIRLWYNDALLRDARSRRSDLQADIDRLDQRIQELESERALLDTPRRNLAGGAAFPAMFLLSAGDSSGVLWLVGLVALAAAGLTFFIWKNGRAIKRGLRTAAMRALTPRDAPTDSGGGAGGDMAEFADPREFEHKFLWDTGCLRKRIQDYLRQRNSLEMFRQMGERDPFEAVNAEGKAETIRILAVTDKQFQRIPPNVRGELLSEQSRWAIVTANGDSQTVEVKPAAPSNGNGRGKRGKVIREPLDIEFDDEEVDA